MRTQRLTLYRRHVSACSEGYEQNEILEDGDTRKKDCACPIQCSGYLDNEPGRIRHRSLETNDWARAKYKASLWLSWKQTTQPGNLVGIDPSKVTLPQAIESFGALNASIAKQGKNTQGKYNTFFELRLKPWCAERGIEFVKAFDDKPTTDMFFNSWKNLQPRKGHKLRAEDEAKELAQRTRRAELERYRSFLGHGVAQGWLKFNHAKAIKMATLKPEPKFAFTTAEWLRLLAILENLPDQYGRLGKDQAEAIRAKHRRSHAFGLLSRYTGQRVGDVAMLGPRSIETDDDGRHFIVLKQQKTGELVKIPVPVSLVTLLRGLPVLHKHDGTLKYRTNNRDYYYGPEFWFWSGQSDIENFTKDWSDDLARVLRLYKKEHGDFEHHATPHTFRHFFAISHLVAGTKIKTVSRWMGHASVEITEQHYGHANADVHEASHDEYMASMAKQEAKERGIKAKGAGSAKVVRIRKAG